MSHPHQDESTNCASDVALINRMSKENGEIKVLLLSANPYSDSGQTRLFNSYFPSDAGFKISQLYTKNCPPASNKCSSFYCLSDKMMFKGLLKKRVNGRVFAPVENPKAQKKKPSPLGRVKGMLTKKTALRYFLRNAIWGGRRWKSPDLLSWAKSSEPDILFLYITDDFYLNNIAMWLSMELGIPLLLNIVDDYYFYREESLSPLFRLYKKKYKKHFVELIHRSSGQIYISPKIRDKYNSHFGTKGIYVQPLSAFTPFPTKNPSKTIRNILFSGTLEPGRYRSIVTFARSLKEADPDARIHVYSMYATKKAIKPLAKESNIILHSPVPYAELLRVINESDALLLVESFRRKDLEFTRYSLSTKTSDSICSGKPLLVYGPNEAGCVDFLTNLQIGFLFSTQSISLEALREALSLNKDKVSAVLDSATKFKKREKPYLAKEYIGKLAGDDTHFSPHALKKGRR